MGRSSYETAHLFPSPFPRFTRVDCWFVKKKNLRLSFALFFFFHFNDLEKGKSGHTALSWIVELNGNKKDSFSTIHLFIYRIKNISYNNYKRYRLVTVMIIY